MEKKKPVVLGKRVRGRRTYYGGKGRNVNPNPTVGIYKQGRARSLNFNMAATNLIFLPSQKFALVEYAFEEEMIILTRFTQKPGGDNSDVYAIGYNRNGAKIIIPKNLLDEFPFLRNYSGTPSIAWYEDDEIYVRL